MEEPNLCCEWANDSIEKIDFHEGTAYQIRVFNKRFNSMNIFYIRYCSMCGTDLVIFNKK